jgi:hypothetical protein
MRGAQLLSEKITSMWQKDGCCEYLQDNSAAANSNVETSQPDGSDGGLLSHITGLTPSKEKLNASKAASQSSPIKRRAAPALTEVMERSTYETAVPGARVLLEVEDEDLVGIDDPCITAKSLRMLFYHKPELAKMIRECIDEYKADEGDYY